MLLLGDPLQRGSAERAGVCLDIGANGCADEL